MNLKIKIYYLLGLSSKNIFLQSSLRFRLLISPRLMTIITNAAKNTSIYTKQHIKNAFFGRRHTKTLITLLLNLALPAEYSKLYKLQGRQLLIATVLKPFLHYKMNTFTKGILVM